MPRSPKRVKKAERKDERRPKKVHSWEAQQAPLKPHLLYLRCANAQPCLRNETGLLRVIFGKLDPVTQALFKQL